MKHGHFEYQLGQINLQNIVKLKERGNNEKDTHKEATASPNQTAAPSLYAMRLIPDCIKKQEEELTNELN